MSSMSLFSGIDHINTHTRLENESFTAIFGSITVDLTRQRLAPGDHTISAFAMFGGGDPRTRRCRIACGRRRDDGRHRIRVAHS